MTIYKSAQKGAWKCNFPAFLSRPIKRRTYQRTDDHQTNRDVAYQRANSQGMNGERLWRII